MEFHNLLLTLFLFASIPMKDYKALGDKTFRILGGRKCKFREFPAQVAIIMLFGPICGGTILDKLHVVTAATCIQEVEVLGFLTVIAGDVRIDTPKSNSRQGIQVLGSISHPEYNRETMKHDIAILILTKPLNLNGKEVRAAHLSSESPRIDTKVIVAGWGRTETAQFSNLCLATQVTILTKDSCALDTNQQGKNTNAASDGRKIVTPDESQICAGDFTGKNGPYLSDSGSPLYVKDKSNNLKFVGIVSYGTGNASVYTDVAYHRNWIMNEIAKAAKQAGKTNKFKPASRRKQNEANVCKKSNKLILFMLPILSLGIKATVS